MTSYFSNNACSETEPKIQSVSDFKMFVSYCELSSEILKSSSDSAASNPLPEREHEAEPHVNLRNANQHEHPIIVMRHPKQRESDWISASKRNLNFYFFK